jgi:hypothetical protein
MSETQDWNSGQGAYPSDRNEWTLTMYDPTGNENVVRHLSTQPTRNEIRSLCDDEMGDAESEVTVAWSLTDVTGEQIDDGEFTLKPTGGAA